MEKFIGITMGDPTGIGPEIIVKVLAKNLPNLKVYGSLDILLKTAKDLGLSFNPNLVDDISLTKNDIDSIKIGSPSRASGLLSYNFIEKAVKDCLSGKIKALVTGPISKYAWRLANINFPGHTELLASLSNFNSSPEVRMLCILV